MATYGCRYRAESSGSREKGASRAYQAHNAPGLNNLMERAPLRPRTCSRSSGTNARIAQQLAFEAPKSDSKRAPRSTDSIVFNREQTRQKHRERCEVWRQTQNSRFGNNTEFERARLRKLARLNQEQFDNGLAEAMRGHAPRNTQPDKRSGSAARVPSRQALSLGEQERRSRLNRSSSHSKASGDPRRGSRSPISMDDGIELMVDDIERLHRRIERALQNPSITSNELQPLLDSLNQREIALAKAIESRKIRERNDNRSIPSDRGIDQAAKTNIDFCESENRRPRGIERWRNRAYVTADERTTSTSDRKAQNNEAGRPEDYQATAFLHELENMLESLGLSEENTRTHDWFHNSGSFRNRAFGARRSENSQKIFLSPFGAYVLKVEQNSPGRRSSTYRYDARARTGRSTENHRDYGRSDPRSASVPYPSPNTLSVNEAQQLFTEYENRWSSLAATDAAIPYPARGLQADALTSRRSIWAGPMLQNHVATWSDETIMQANAHAFFLGAVGLRPRYTPISGSGDVAIDFDRDAASPTQLRQLAEIVKREKMRWHSDRLGRRTEGLLGVNEALQQDSRARAVFHSICALGEKH